ncbi:aminodeoxychorismate lyase [Brevibacillus migulae]|uniref:aminodeoxychorismate lyase n=1 Tax=Brevibacillus migulae TaxID=1644114 RepID=UPI00106E193E|nr:aminodeoxychorismate lyase [Brevibacillus migulae]
MLLYINGEIVSEENAVVSVMDHGFLYGVGLFETVRIYDGKLFLWKEHVARLMAGLSALHITHDWTADFLAEAVLHTVQANGLQDAYVRLNVTGGAEGVGLIAGPYTKPSLFIFVKPVAPIPAHPSAKRLQTVSIPRQTPEGQRRYKSHNFLNNVLAKQEAGPDLQVEGLLLTREGYVAEGVVSNVFWVRDHILYTPSTAAGILEGVTRGFVLTLARQLGIPWQEGLYPLDQLYGADEVFVTNSIQEIVPVSQIDGNMLPTAYGAVTKRLREAYRDAVAL